MQYIRASRQIPMRLLPGYWQQKVDYRIEVTLDDKAKALDGFESIQYKNNSPDTLSFIWFHLWPNAYKNDRTAFSNQLLENRNSKFYFSGADKKGYINRLSFKVNNELANTEDHPEHIDIIKLLLPSPLAPGKSVQITTPFHVKLPYNFSRSGYNGETFQVTQWYPKPAVYDQTGWHPMPYLDQGEFYSEFGDFDVTVTLPANYVVAATGILQEQHEIDWLKTRTSFKWIPTKTKEKNKYGQVKTTIQEYPPSSGSNKTISFKQKNVHDFAWFADKRFIVQQDTCLLTSGKSVKVASYYIDAQKEDWEQTVGYAKAALRFYSDHIGDYPYEEAKVVLGPDASYGGMEYPGITIIEPGLKGNSLDNVIAHELGHNWFYGALASNERDYPWMDEGLNSYYDQLYSHSRYPAEALSQKGNYRLT
ncbi:MAG: M1 family peptidase, partial [Pedobacter sp.]